MTVALNLQIKAYIIGKASPFQPDRVQIIHCRLRYRFKEIINTDSVLCEKCVAARYINCAVNTHKLKICKGFLKAQRQLRRVGSFRFFSDKHLVFSAFYVCSYYRYFCKQSAAFFFFPLRYCTVPKGYQASRFEAQSDTTKDHTVDSFHERYLF